MSDLRKIKLSGIFSTAQFWYPTIILYYQSQGLSIEQIYLILTIYSICAVLFEYPTGVIADYFSPRVSLIVGFGLMSLFMFLCSLPGSFSYYCVLFICNAAAYTLTSGSNTALLHSVSKNFKHDYSQVKLYSLIMAVFSTVVGGLTIAINLKVSLYLTSLFLLLSALLLLFSRSYPYERIRGNIFTGSLIGLRHVKQNTQLLYLILISSLIGGLFMSFKFFYTPLFSAMKLPETSWGVYIGLATLCSALGVYLFKKYDTVNARLLLGGFLVSFLLIGLIISPFIALGGLFIAFLIRGYLEARIDTDINETITSHARASILSFESFLTRMIATIFTFAQGLVVEKVAFPMIIIGTTLILFVIGIYPLIKSKKL